MTGNIATINNRDNNHTSFVQWDKRTISMHRELVMKSPISAVVLDILIEQMDNQNAVVCSYKTLENLTGKSKPSVSRALKVLKEDRWIQVVKVGNVNAYVVNSSAFWQTKIEKKVYAKFSATILACSDEQEPATLAIKKGDLKEIPIVRPNEFLIEK